MKTLIGTLLLIASTAWPTTWTCTKDFSVQVAQYYETVGFCTGSGAYTVGGDPIGASAVGSAAAQAVCGSNAQVLVDLIVQADSLVGDNYLMTFTPASFKMQCYQTAICDGKTSGALPQTISTGCVTLTNSSFDVACTDTTAAAAVKCTLSAGTLAVAGTGSDVINFVIFAPGGALSECPGGALGPNPPPNFHFRAICR